MKIILKVFPDLLISYFKWSEKRIIEMEYMVNQLVAEYFSWKDVKEKKDGKKLVINEKHFSIYYED